VFALHGMRGKIRPSPPTLAKIIHAQSSNKQNRINTDEKAHVKSPLRYSQRKTFQAQFIPDTTLIICYNNYKNKKNKKIMYFNVFDIITHTQYTFLVLT